MPTLILAFAAGVLTILSPCTLPLVPAIVGSTIARERWARLAGVLVGFGGTFVVIAVVLAAVLADAGVTLGPARLIAAGLLGILGVTLVVPALERRFERLASPFASRVAQLVPRSRSMGPAGEAVRGVALGSLLGFVWAPCVGPLMAGVIALAVIAGPSIGGLAVAVAFVLGVSTALAIVALGVRRLASPRQWIGLRSRRFTGVAMVLTAALVLSGLDARLGIGLSIAPDSVDESVGGAAAVASLPDLGSAPELTGITGWINSEPVSLSDLRGTVVLVHFWTFGCSNCQAVQPYVKAWFDRYRDEGFTVIGVHTPELSFERDLGNVRQAVARADIRFPVAFDPEFATWDAYRNQYWPAFYFVDKRGHIRHEHFGEGDYAGSEDVIRRLIAERA